MSPPDGRRGGPYPRTRLRVVAPASTPADAAIVACRRAGEVARRRLRDRLDGLAESYARSGEAETAELARWLTEAVAP